MSAIRQVLAFTIATSAVTFTTAAELRTHSGDHEIHRAVAFVDAVESELVSVASGGEFIEGELIEGPCQCSECTTPAGKHHHWLSSCRTWASAEYLLWWRRGREFPPLATGPTAAGVLPTTEVLFGNDRVGHEARPGGRVQVGMWLDDCDSHAFEGRFFIVGTQRVGFSATNATATNQLNRPYSDGTGQFAQPLRQDVPGFGPGSIDIRSDSNILGGDFLYRRLACTIGGSRCDWLVGYQFSRIDEDLRIDDNTTTVVGIVSNNIRGFDEWRVRNQFHGAVIGLNWAYGYGAWNVDLLAKVGLGNMRETLRTSGQTVITPTGGGAATTRDYGLLVGTNNLERDRFSAVPELGLTFERCVNEHLELSFGYSFILWSRAAQPGDQIRTGPLNAPLSNANNAAPADRPDPLTAIEGSVHWMHGLNVGAKVDF